MPFCRYRYRAGKWQKECESDEEVGKCGNVVYHLSEHINFQLFIAH